MVPAVYSKHPGVVSGSIIGFKGKSRVISGGADKSERTYFEMSRKGDCLFLSVSVGVFSVSPVLGNWLLYRKGHRSTRHAFIEW